MLRVNTRMHMDAIECARLKRPHTRKRTHETLVVFCQYTHASSVGFQIIRSRRVSEPQNSWLRAPCLLVKLFFLPHFGQVGHCRMQVREGLHYNPYFPVSISPASPLAHIRCNCAPSLAMTVWLGILRMLFQNELRLHNAKGR